MAYSSLASKSIISPNYTKRASKIDCVSIHCPCGKLSLDSMGAIYKDTKNKSSCHYGIDVNGNIAVFVDEKNAAMALSSTGADNRSISIMISAINDKEPYQVSNAAYQSVQDLLVDICIRNNIKELKWMDDAKYGVASGSSGPVAKQNVLIHSWFSKKPDPGKWVHDHIAEIVQVVNTQLVIDRENMRRIIFIGDSRASAIHSTIGTDLNFWFTKKDPACTWTGYKTFPYQNEIGPKTAVCILGGWNDPDYTKAKDYATKINNYASQWILKGSAVYFTTITPVSRTGHGNMTNKKIEAFNKAMRENLLQGVGYIDAYSAVKDSFIVTDGLKYDDNTNKLIYSTVIAQAARLTGGVRLNLNLNLDPTNFHPYVAMFDRSATVNYKQLHDLRVAGAMIEAGYRYNTNHQETKKFDNPNLSTQIENLEKYEIPYGMYTICRATTRAEAKTEINYFQYQLYRHPPTLGAWINIVNLGTVKKTNDVLLTQYNDSLTELGFRGRMGIITTRKLLDNISWDKWQDEFYLYLIDHVTDLSVMDNILDPQLFDVDGTEPTISTTYQPTLLTTQTTTQQSSNPAFQQVLATGANAVTRNALVRYAVTFVGSPYKYGASGTKPGQEMDCSGFICAVFEQFGMNLRPNRRELTTAYGQVVSLANAQPGDVMHYPGHVALYIGDGKLVEAANENVGVRITNVYSGCDRVANIIDHYPR